MAESDWVDKTTENVARLLLVAEALGMRKAATMAEKMGIVADGYEIAVALRARATRIERGEDTPAGGT